MGYIIGLDLSICNTGWSIIDSKGKYINSGTIKTEAAKKTGICSIQRLYYIKQQLDFVISKYKPKIAVIENYAYGVKKSKSVFQIGELGGVIRFLLFIRKINFFVCSPLSLKKYATGKGSGKKNVIIKGVFKKYGMEFKTDDEVDAFVLGKIGYGICKYKKEKNGLKEYEKEVIKVILENAAFNNWEIGCKKYEVKIKRRNKNERC